MASQTSYEPSHASPLDAEIQAWLRLLLTPGIGRGTARKLLARAGNAEGIWHLPLSAWAECATQAQIKALAELPADWSRHCDTLAQWLAAPAPGTLHTVICLGHAQYPDCLLQTEDPPLMLFVQGPEALLSSNAPWFPYPATLAVVGSRNHTPQGVLNARNLSQALTDQGLCIVSGLARGIDAAAHEGALKSTAQHLPLTIAVVGTGLDQVYPKGHTALARQVAQRGLIISEYPLGSEPLPRHFPQRNRIISGLSQGTLVVEAALKSGSLITARLATEQGREVFAIPGSIHAPQSRGCHELLRQGATLVESADDILHELQGIKTQKAEKNQAPSAIKNDVPKDEHPLLKALGYEPMSLETLSANTGWDAAHLQAQLMELELDGVVARLPGGLYQRISQG